MTCTRLEKNVGSKTRKGMGKWRRDSSGSLIALEKWQVRPKWPSSHLAPPHMKVGSNSFHFTTAINLCPRVFFVHYSCGLLPWLKPRRSLCFFFPTCPSIPPQSVIHSSVLLTKVCPFVPTNIPLRHGCPSKKTVLYMTRQSGICHTVGKKSEGALF